MSLNTDARDARVEYMVDSVQTYLVRIHPDHTPEDILKPHYFQTIPELQPGDRIVVESQDVSWTQTLRVMEVDNMAGRTLVSALGDVVKFARGRVPQGYEIRFIALDAGFVVINPAGDTIGANYATHQGALTWLRTQVGEEPVAPRSSAKQRETADV